jgi:hypothetical protein
MNEKKMKPYKIQLENIKHKWKRSNITTFDIPYSLTVSPD